MIWVGDDWAEDHHDVEIQGEDGRRLARARLPEGLEGVTRLHALIAEHMPASWADLESAEAAGRVGIGIETDRGTWVRSACGRLSGVCDQSDVGGSLSGAALHLGCQV